MIPTKIVYVCDNKRHLVCVPYSIDNLHLMAKDLGIKKCWFHRSHYDIPSRRIKEIEKKCHLASPKEIVEIIRHPEYAKIILAPEVKGGAAPQDFFLKTQIDYNG